MNYSKTANAPMTGGSMTNGAMTNGRMGMGNRDQVIHWQGTQSWDDIDRAVDEENQLKVAAQFLSCYPQPDATYAPRGIISTKTNSLQSNQRPILSIQQSDTVPLIEIDVQFALTDAQVKKEGQSQLGVTLAHRAGALLALGEDFILFQGDNALGTELFVTHTVETDGSPAGTGLVNIPSGDHVIKVFPVEVDDDDPTQNKYGENTFGAVAQAFALLRQTHYGRCALVLHTNVYADTYAALPETLAVPAERIKGLVGDLFYTSSTLPERTGILVAIDGDTMDLVVGQDPFTEFTQVNNSQWIFRLYERIGLRVKDPTAVVRLEFQLKKKSETEGEYEAQSSERR